MADDDKLDPIPLFQEDEDTVRDRMNEAANAELHPSDSRWVDTRIGSVFYTLTQPSVQEHALAWDALAVEVASAALPTRAWGDYLDEWAETVGLVRKPPAAASGSVLFEGEEGALIPAQLELSAVQVDPDIEPPEFLTTGSGGALSTALVAPTGLNVTVSAGGTLVASTEYFYVVTAYNAYGKTIASTQDSVTTSGSDRQATLDWNDVPGAVGYIVYRSTATGVERYLDKVVVSTYVDNGTVAPDPDLAPPSSNTTGGKFRTSVVAKEPGALGNVGMGAISELDTPLEGVDTVTNEEPTTGGADREDDDDLRVRIYLQFQVAGGGNQADFERWALETPGVGFVTVVPAADGPGTVRIIVMDSDHRPVGADIVERVQERLDPLPGQGAGIAPVGDTVTVVTPAQVLIDVIADITFESGFSLDGTGGTVALRDSIALALTTYLNALEAGEDVIRDHVLAQVYSVRGVYKVNSLTIEGATTDVTITATPAQVASLGTVTLTE